MASDSVLSEALNIASRHIVAGQIDDAASICREVLMESPENSAVYYLLTLIAIARRDFAEAVNFADFAIEKMDGVAEVYVEKARAYIGLGDQVRAAETLRKAISLSPDVPDGYGLLSGLLMPGENYYSVLKRFHEWLQPKAYLEVGVCTGHSLALATPPTVAVGIDPNPAIITNFTAKTSIFKVTSDDYFTTRNPYYDLENNGIDLAFIDGLHVFEQALKDFIMVQRFSKPDTVVLFHDCLPIDELTAAADRKTVFWSGDVWKVITALIKWCPDLDVFTIATQPTGLGVVVGLDAKSTILSDNYDAIVAEFHDRKVPADFQTTRNLVHAVANDWPAVVKRIAAKRSVA